MNHHVKKYSFEIKDNKCEICGEQAITGQLDKSDNIRYSCLEHVKEVFDKARKS